MDKAELEQILLKLAGLPVHELASINALISQMVFVTKTNEQVNLFSNDLPELHVTPEIILPFVNYLFISFVEQIFNNNYSEDYRLGDPVEPSNDNSVTVSLIYNALKTAQVTKPGQKPRVVVRATGVQTGTYAIGNDPAQVDKMHNYQGKLVKIPIEITALSNNASESDFLGGFILGAVMANQAEIRKLFSFYQISDPVMEAASLKREFQDTFGTTVSFFCMKHVTWDKILVKKAFKQMFFRLIGCVANDTTAPVIQALGNYSFLDPQLRKLIIALGDNPDLV